MGITRKEFAWLRNSKEILSSGDVVGCPTYGGKRLNRECTLIQYIQRGLYNGSSLECQKCWNKEIPYIVKAQAKKKRRFGEFKFNKGDTFTVLSVNECFDYAVLIWDPFSGMHNAKKEWFYFYLLPEREITGKEAFRILEKEYGCPVRIKKE